MLKIYFKPNCSTCQTALSLMKKNTDEDYEIVEYLVEVPTEKEIKEILKMLGMKAEDLVRKKEKLVQRKIRREENFKCSVDKNSSQESNTHRASDICKRWESDNWEAGGEGVGDNLKKFRAKAQ